MKPRLTIAFALTLAAGCAHAPAPATVIPRLDNELRFVNAPPVVRVDPGDPIPRPTNRPFLRRAYYFDTYLGRRAARLLDTRPGRALNVNALDEVPDSPWFENRIGVRPVSEAELRMKGSPGPRPPFAVLGTKIGGVSPGVLVRDATGTRYLLKFDLPGDPDTETAADVIAQRLLWAVGYHTPEDRIVFFRAEDLHLAAGAEVKDVFGDKRPMTEADLQGVLASIDRRPDGSVRGLVSQLLHGVPLGGYPQESVRADDPNDRVPHEDRRDLRGARVFFSWLNHVDVKEDNTLDMWVPVPGGPDRGVVWHHLVDFGNSLGTFHWRRDPSAGFTHFLDAGHGLRSLVSFGLWRRPWEGVRSSPLPGVGNFESARFDPAGWRPRSPWAPFERQDRFDGLWATKILMRVGPRLIAAAVDEAHYADPRAAAFVARTLRERQIKIGRHWLRQASPLDAFEVTAQGATNRLCFQDLLLTHFGDDGVAAETQLRVVAWDFAGRPLPFASTRAGTARVCLEGLSLTADHDGYTIVDITTIRSGDRDLRILVHLARDPGTGRPRVIGVRRL